VGHKDTSFGATGTGYITIDFGSTSGVSTDGAKAIALRTIGSRVDILVAGYTWAASPINKYQFALVDLLDDHFFHVQ
jgi:hypothetical protein